MILRFKSKGNFEKASSWLKESSKMDDYKKLFQKYGEFGVQKLQEYTPKRTGETAAGWDYELNQNGNKIEVYFVNTAHPELSVNLAKIIQLGHGTRNGGYVPPVNYIHPAMATVYKKVGDDLVRRFKL